MLAKQLCIYQGQGRIREKGSVGARPEQEKNMRRKNQQKLSIMK